MNYKIQELGFYQISQQKNKELFYFEVFSFFCRPKFHLSLSPDQDMLSSTKKDATKTKIYFVLRRYKPCIFSYAHHIKSFRSFFPLNMVSFYLFNSSEGYLLPTVFQNALNLLQSCKWLNF